MIDLPGIDQPEGNGVKVSPSTPAAAWYAVYTVVRHEKTVQKTLLRRNVETFLPLREQTMQWKDRKKRIQFPLFPGYLFVNIELKDRWKVLDARGVVRILCERGFPSPVPDYQIESVKQLLDSQLVFDRSPYMTEGTEVVVTSGPLRGVRGNILEIKDQRKLILSIDFIQEALAVIIDEKDIELV